MNVNYSHGTPAKACKVKKGDLKMQRRNVKFEKISMIQNVAILQLLNFDKKHLSDEQLTSCVYLTFDPGQKTSTHSHIEKKPIG